MDNKKFETEINTLKKFYEFYCETKHQSKVQKEVSLQYKNETYTLNLNLCDECLEAINYSFSRLQQCPHEVKPRCRTCPNPCYEKQRWRATAKVMKYSAINLGLSKIKSKVKNFFS